MGASLDRTPKCHPELVGEGIEYCWGLAKLFYRRSPIGSNCSKENFRSLGKEATDPLGNLGVKNVRSCAKKARSYMKLYQAVEELNSEDGSHDFKSHSILVHTTTIYNSMKKASKSHRRVLGRDVDNLVSVF